MPAGFSYLGGYAVDLKWKTLAAKVDKLADRKFNFTFSTKDVDRDHDVIDQIGIDLKPFKSNPVVLWAHDHSTPPIGRVPAMWIRDGALMGTIEFPEKGIHPLADTVAGLVEHDFINATSIGFQPKEWTFDEERGGINFEKIELYEISLVPVPANRDALRDAEAKGLEVEPVLKWARAIVEKHGAPPPIPEGMSPEAVQELVRKTIESIHHPAPPATPTPPPDRKLTQTERGSIQEAVTAALKQCAGRKVQEHTGRLED